MSWGCRKSDTRTTPKWCHFRERGLRTKTQGLVLSDLASIGATGFEPATSASRTQRSTRLSHAPQRRAKPVILATAAHGSTATGHKLPLRPRHPEVRFPPDTRRRAAGHGYPATWPPPRCCETPPGCHGPAGTGDPGQGLPSSHPACRAATRGCHGSPPRCAAP